MSQPPVVLVVIRNDLHLDKLMRGLKGHGLVAFGTSSLDEAVRLMAMLRPEVVVIDPTSDECAAVLDEKSAGWQSLGLVPVVESEKSAESARELGIDEVIMAKDTSAAVSAVLDLLLQVSPPLPAAGKRLLIVDDDPELVGILADLLKGRGYNVVEAASGREALEVLEHDSGITLVLLDVVLPEGGGIETLRTIKQRYPRLTVILMTGMADTETADHAERLGAFDYIQKPIDYDELEGRIIAGLDDKEKT
jgi:CheY-like chemotaxis protein